MKQLLVKTLLALTLVSPMAHAGPGSGNGDDGTLMLAKISQEHGFNEFQSLVFAFNSGIALTQESTWASATTYRYTNDSNADSGLALQAEDRTGGGFGLFKSERASILGPVWYACETASLEEMRNDAGAKWLDDERTSCTSQTIQGSVFVRDNSLGRTIITNINEDTGKAGFKSEADYRVNGSLLISIVRADSKNTCASPTTVPQNGICEITYYKRLNPSSKKGKR